MIKLQGSLPKTLAIGVSGGLDSMAALCFLNKKHDVLALIYQHEAKEADAVYCAVNFCKENGIAFEVKELHEFPSPGISLEAFWRNHRYNWFHSFNMPVVTAHHLGDCVENWIFSSLRFLQREFVPYRNKNVIRPFRLTKKSDFQKYAAKNNVPYVEDLTNLDLRFDRNYIRHVLLPAAYRVNPGLDKMVAAQIRKDAVE